QLKPPKLEVDFPILAGEWTIWLPNEFVALGNDTLRTDGSDGWRQRLFGPLGRPSLAQPFDPFASATWSKLITSWVDEKPNSESPTTVRMNAEGVEGTDTNTKAVPVLANLRLADHVGWRAYRSAFVSAAPEPAVVVRPPAIATWSIALFLLCAVGGSWIRRHR